MFRSSIWIYKMEVINNPSIIKKTGLCRWIKWDPSANENPASKNPSLNCFQGRTLLKPTQFVPESHMSRHLYKLYLYSIYTPVWHCEGTWCLLMIWPDPSFWGPQLVNHCPSSMSISQLPSARSIRILCFKKDDLLRTVSNPQMSQKGKHVGCRNEVPSTKKRMVNPIQWMVLGTGPVAHLYL